MIFFINNDTAIIATLYTAIREGEYGICKELFVQK